MKTYTEALENYNRAVRCADEEERQKVKGTWTSEANMKASKTTMLSIIKEQANKEFNALQDYLNGKIDEPKKTRIIGNVVSEDNLLYFEYPAEFEKDIAGLENDLGDLSDSDLAWIENTKNLIQKYHAVVYKGEKKKARKPMSPERKSLLSKVCRIANRIPRSVCRKEAFTKAWAIAKNGGFEIAVAGVSFGSRQKALARLAKYNPKDVFVMLIPEADCEFDPEAVAIKVMVKNGKGVYTLGYVPRTETAIAKALLGKVPEFRLVGGETMGARIRLAA